MVEADELLLDNVFDHEAEARVLDHMNKDHTETLVKYCKDFNLDLKVEDYSMCGIDTEGIDIIAGKTNIRISFKKPLDDASQAREVLVQMAQT